MATFSGGGSETNPFTFSTFQGFMDIMKCINDRSFPSDITEEYTDPYIYVAMARNSDDSPRTIDLNEEFTNFKLTSTIPIYNNRFAIDINLNGGIIKNLLIGANINCFTAGDYNKWKMHDGAFLNVFGSGSNYFIYESGNSSAGTFENMSFSFDASGFNCPLIFNMGLNKVSVNIITNNGFPADSNSYYGAIILKSIKQANGQLPMSDCDIKVTYKSYDMSAFSSRKPTVIGTYNGYGETFIDNSRIVVEANAPDENDFKVLNSQMLIQSSSNTVKVTNSFIYEDMGAYNAYNDASSVKLGGDLNATSCVVAFNPPKNTNTLTLNYQNATSIPFENARDYNTVSGVMTVLPAP